MDLSWEYNQGTVILSLQMVKVVNRGGPMSSRNVAAEVKYEKILPGLCTFLCSED